MRGLYLPFESGQLAGTSDVYVHEIPGGQYTNLLFQSKQLGLSEKWAQIKKAYAQADPLLGPNPNPNPNPNPYRNPNLPSGRARKAAMAASAAASASEAAVGVVVVMGLCGEAAALP